MPVGQMLRSMSSSELTEWIAFITKVEPEGGYIDDFRAAIGAAATKNAHRGRRDKAVSPYDLVPWSEHGSKSTTQPGVDPAKAFGQYFEAKEKGKH